VIVKHKQCLDYTVLVKDSNNALRCCIQYLGRSLACILSRWETVHLYSHRWSWV